MIEEICFRVDYKTSPHADAKTAAGADGAVILAPVRHDERVHDSELYTGKGFVP